jgi:hypothetical protein
MTMQVDDATVRCKRMSVPENRRQWVKMNDFMIVLQTVDGLRDPDVLQTGDGIRDPDVVCR